MFRYNVRDATLIFKVLVVPRASRSEIVGEHMGAIKVRVAAAPVDGAANEELTRILARALNVSRREVQVISGHTSRQKQVQVTNVQPQTLEALKLIIKTER